MRKLLSLFLWALLVVYIPIEGKCIDASKRPLKINGDVVSSISKKPVFQPRIIHSDSLTVLPKDAVFHKKHRLIAALLAFPLGVFGLHRIYMGTRSIVPFIYIVTFGGVFGVLPFIDFVLILLNKDIHLTYTSNYHIFMWQKR
jgi:TM2 domain-containing membrane protein YozV